MRSRIFKALCTISLSAPLATSSLALAQDAEEGSDAEMSDTSETQGADVVDMAPQTPKVAGARETAPGTTHTVETGDTLWDLSQRYLGSPWYWPKVWSYNPQIANPHWIYPGNQVRFYAGGEGAPAQVEIDSGEALDAPTELEGDNGFSVAGKIGYEPQASRRSVQEGFVTEDELKEAGKIDKAFSEANMLSQFDKVYVKFENQNDARVGDRYVIFRTVKDVRHPNSGERFGVLTKFLGVLQVTEVHEKTVSATITNAYDEINRGDLVGRSGEQLMQTVSSRPNDKTLEATVVTAIIPHVTLYGEHHEIVLDLGSADGVQEGNTFKIVRRQDQGGNFLDPSKGQDADLPAETVGRCMAMTVKEKSTTCALTSTLREIVPGDKAVMTPESAPSASR